MWLTEKLQQGASSMHRPAPIGSSEAEMVMEGTYFLFELIASLFYRSFYILLTCHSSQMLAAPGLIHHLKCWQLQDLYIIILHF